MTAPTTKARSKASGVGADALYQECAAFLFKEAELLDARRFADWLGCLHEDLFYEIPIRVTVGMERLGDEFSTRGFHMQESFKSMEMRVNRLATEHAYAEDPPSRTTRLVTNVRVGTVVDQAVEVRSNLLLYRSQGPDTGTSHDLIVGERQDQLRQTADGWKLASRRVLLAHTTIPTANLGVFL